MSPCPALAGDHWRAALAFQVTPPQEMSLSLGEAFISGAKWLPYRGYSRRTYAHNVRLDSLIIFIMAKLFKAIKYNEKNLVNTKTSKRVLREIK